MFKVEEVPCETCGVPTTFTGTKRCNDCWEVEARIAGYLRRGGLRAKRLIRDLMNVATADDFRCIDCNGLRDQAYMLRDAVWKEAVPDYPQRKLKKRFVHVCIRCVERRLKRPITLDDLTDKPINDLARVGARLAQRDADELRAKFQSGAV